MFQKQIYRFAKEFGLHNYEVQCPEPKAFSRALNKVNSDYAEFDSPRGGYNVDIIRCLLVPRDVDQVWGKLPPYILHVIVCVSPQMPYCTTHPVGANPFFLCIAWAKHDRAVNK